MDDAVDAPKCNKTGVPPALLPGDPAQTTK